MKKICLFVIILSIAAGIWIGATQVLDIPINPTQGRLRVGAQTPPPHEGIEGATVEVRQVKDGEVVGEVIKATTGRDGWCKFDLPPGEYHIAVYKIGYTSISTLFPVTVKVREVSRYAFILEPT